MHGYYISERKSSLIVSSSSSFISWLFLAYNQMSKSLKSLDYGWIGTRLVVWTRQSLLFNF
jgi:predicted N-acyltransferase